MDDDKAPQPETDAPSDDPWEDPAGQERLRSIYSRSVGSRMRPGQAEAREHLQNRMRHSPRTFLLVVAFSVAVLAIGYALAS